jgi:hypothetical protein
MLNDQKQNTQRDIQCVGEIATAMLRPSSQLPSAIDFIEKTELCSAKDLLNVSYESMSKGL